MPLNLTNHKAIDTYYSALANYQTQGVTHEQATRLAFSTLLDTLSKTVGWTLVLEQTLSNRKRPDGTLQDSFKIPRGYWESKRRSSPPRPLKFHERLLSHHHQPH